MSDSVRYADTVSNHERLKLWAEALRGAVLRSGEHFTGELMMEEVPGGYRLSLALSQPLCGEVRAAAKALIRAHARSSGWRISALACSEKHVSLAVRRRHR